MSRSTETAALAALADELSERRRRLRGDLGARRQPAPELGLSVDLSGGAAVIEPMTVDQLREAVLTVVAGGSFADRRTEAQAWEECLRKARTQVRLIDRAHEELKRLGQPRGVLGLLEQV